MNQAVSKRWKSKMKTLATQPRTQNQITKKDIAPVTSNAANTSLVISNVAINLVKVAINKAATVLVSNRITITASKTLKMPRMVSKAAISPVNRVDTNHDSKAAISPANREDTNRASKAAISLANRVGINHASKAATSLVNRVGINRASKAATSLANRVGINRANKAAISPEDISRVDISRGSNKVDSSRAATSKVDSNKAGSASPKENARKAPSPKCVLPRVLNPWNTTSPSSIPTCRCV